MAAGFEHEKAYLSFQEYFGKLKDDPTRWGKPVASVLGALMAQADLGVGAIGGKDSMSGSFEDLDVPPTLISFAVAVGDMRHATSPEFKKAGHRIVRIAPRYLDDGLTPDKDGPAGRDDDGRIPRRPSMTRSPSPRRATARRPRRCSR